MKVVRAFDIQLPAVIAEWSVDGFEGGRYRVVMGAETVEPGEVDRPLKGRNLCVEHCCEDAMGVERWHTVEPGEAVWILSQLLVASVGLAPEFTGWLWGRKPLPLVDGEQ